MTNLQTLFDTNSFLKTSGYLGLFLMVFAETGLLIGLILPGETLVFTAGFFSSLGYFNIWLVMGLTFIAAVFADSAEYSLGKKYGILVFQKSSWRWINKDQIKRAEDFYNQYGGKAIIAARFLPFIRTLAPLMAGIGKMRYQTFVIYNVVGGLLWAVTVSLLGYFLGQIIPHAQGYILLIITLVVAITAVPMVLKLWQHKS